MPVLFRSGAAATASDLLNADRPANFSATPKTRRFVCSSSVHATRTRISVLL